MNRREYIQNTCLLLGYAASAGLVSTLLDSCKADSKKSGQGPAYYTDDEFSTLTAILDTLLPKTTTPGALDTDVPMFIDKMTNEVMSIEDQKVYREGIADIDAQSKALFKKSFVDASQEQRTVLLSKLDKETPKFPPSMWGFPLSENPHAVPFFRKLKSLSLMAYFTSAQVAGKHTNSTKGVG
jgi:hypothetical protein